MLIGRVARALVGVVVGGFAGAAVVLTPFSVLAALLLGTLTAMIAFAVTDDRPEPARPPDRRRALASARRAGALVGVGTLVLVGAVAVIGVATAPLLVAAAVVAVPWIWSRRRARADRSWGAPAPSAAPQSADPPSAAPPSADAPAADAPAPRSGPADRVRWTPPPRPGVPAPVPAPRLDTLSIAALCTGWQDSYHVLRETRDHRVFENLVGLRRRYLDEFERRDPAGVARWLAADPRPAAVSPRRHLSVAPAPPPPPG